MGRMYTAEFSKVEVSADQDVFEIVPADERAVAIHAVYIAQSSDVADAAEEILDIKIMRGFTSGGSSGSSSTPAPISPLDTAAGAAVEVNNTTIATTGTIVDCHSDSFNIRAGLQLVFTPECRPITTATNTSIVVRILADLADAVTMSGTIVFEELA